MYIVRAELKRCFGPGILIPALLLSFFAGYILYELHDDYDSSYCLTADEIKTEYVIACDLITGGYSKTTDLLTRYKELVASADKIIASRKELYNLGITNYDLWKELRNRVSLTEDHKHNGGTWYYESIEPVNETVLGIFRNEFYTLYGFPYYYDIPWPEGDIVTRYEAADDEDIKLFITLEAYESKPLSYIAENGGQKLEADLRISYWNQKYGTDIPPGENTILPFFVFSKVQYMLFSLCFLSVCFFCFCIMIGRAGSKCVYAVPCTCKIGKRYLDRGCFAVLTAGLFITGLLAFAAIYLFPHKIAVFGEGMLNSEYNAYCQPMYWISLRYGLFLLLESIILILVISSANLFAFSAACFLKSKLAAAFVYLILCAVYYFVSQYIFFDLRYENFGKLNGPIFRFIASFTSAHPAGIEIITALVLAAASVVLYLAARAKFIRLANG